MLVVITGLSGSGRSEAANCLEDLGFFVIDNLPPSLIPKVLELAGPSIERLCLTMGTERYSDEIAPAVADLRATAEGAPHYRDVRLWFLEARTQVLVQRYESSRRRHPFALRGSVEEAVEAERESLCGLRAEADVVIDTSDTNVHELRDRIDRLIGDAVARRLITRVLSFSFKHGLPADVDMVFDCRFLPNPYWVPELRPLDGTDGQVRDYVTQSDLGKRFVRSLDELYELLLPAFESEGKTYLTLAFGCTGGKASLGVPGRAGGCLPAAARIRSAGAASRSATLRAAGATAGLEGAGDGSIRRVTHDGSGGDQRIRADRAQLLPRACDHGVPPSRWWR